MSSTTGKARQRCASFSGDEKLLIANICVKYKNIIENKKTDHISNDEKNKIWEKIATEVNATAVNTTYRTSEVLKRFYENRKREVRKIAAEEKNEIFATGGGPCKTIKKDVCHDIILSIMNQKTVYGLQNEFDADIELTKEPNEVGIVTTNRETNYQNSDIDDMDTVYELENEQGEFTWKKYIPADLQQPITPNLKNPILEPSERTNNEETNNAIHTPNAKSSKSLPSSRRRPTMQVKSLARSDIAEKYDQLLDKRLEIAEFQKKKLAEELVTIEGERNLKYQLLELQIQVNKEKLKKLQN